MSSTRLLAQTNKVCYGPAQVNKIAEYSKECELSKLNLETMKQQYDKSLELATPQEPYIGDKTVFATTIFLSFLAGFIASKQVR